MHVLQLWLRLHELNMFTFVPLSPRLSQLLCKFETLNSAELFSHQQQQAEQEKQQRYEVSSQPLTLRNVPKMAFFSGKTKIIIH